MKYPDGRGEEITRRIGANLKRPYWTRRSDYILHLCVCFLSHLIYLGLNLGIYLDLRVINTSLLACVDNAVTTHSRGEHIRRIGVFLLSEQLYCAALE